MDWIGIGCGGGGKVGGFVGAVVMRVILGGFVQEVFGFRCVDVEY